MNGMFKRAFTLIEVNLAIFIMAGGVLAMISLYSLGFRESRQSKEDLASATFADMVLNPLVVALSSTNLTWSTWKQIQGKFDKIESESGYGDVYVLPKHSSGEDAGWMEYIKTDGTFRAKDGYIEEHKTYYVLGNLKRTADSVYNQLMSSADSSILPSSVTSAPEPPKGMTYALVASCENENSPIITLAVRCVRENLRNMLMAQPVFMTEVRFQGDPNR